MYLYVVQPGEESFWILVACKCQSAVSGTLLNPYLEVYGSLLTVVSFSASGHHASTATQWFMTSVPASPGPSGLSLPVHARSQRCNSAYFRGALPESVRGLT